MNDVLSSRDAPDSYSAAFTVFCQQASVRWIALFFLSSALWRLSEGDLRLLDVLMCCAAIAAWPVLEWGLHRFALHAKPMTWGNRQITFDFARKHEQHHAQPWRTAWVFLPWYVPVTLAPLLLILAAGPAVSPLVLSFYVGLGVAALNYEWSHWIVHTRIKPKNRYYQRMFRHHRMHHFRHEGYWFSFMWPSLDCYLGTGPDEQSVAFSATARDINRTSVSATHDGASAGKK